MKLSIITINYNNLDGLKRTYESVVSQTCQDFEWIIIDGGSTDGSKEFIEEHQAHFAYWCSEPDKGVYNAMNKGIVKANGEYLNFMNSGDSFYDEHTLKNVFSQELVADLVYGDWIRMLEDGEEDYRKGPNEAANLTIYLKNICHQAMFIKSSVMKESGYDETYKIIADWKYWIKMAIDGCSFQYIPIAICRFEAGIGISERNPRLRYDEIKKLSSELPGNMGEVFLKYHTMYANQWEYDNNPLISCTIRIASEGVSYKTKIIHISLSIINFLEKII